MKRGSSLRRIEWPMPQILASVLGVVMTKLLTHLLGRVLDSLDDVDVAGAAAEIARDRLADLLLARVLVPLEQRDARHHHSRRTVAALQAVLLGEPLLHGVELAALLEVLDGPDLATVGLHGEHGARFHRLAVEMHGASAAMRRIATDVGAGQPQHLADEVHEQQPRFDLRLVSGPVDGHVDAVLGHGQRPPARSTALRSARPASTRAISRLYSTDPR